MSAWVRRGENEKPSTVPASSQTSSMPRSPSQSTNERASVQSNAATVAAFDWTDALSLVLWLGERGIEDVWLEAGTVDGFSFSPLRTHADIVAEAKAMQNCVRTYG